MINPSPHRLRAEEKRLFRKAILVILFSIITFMAIIFGGLPLLAKIIISTSPARKESVAENSTSDNIQPPVLDPIAESTNSGKVKISGYAKKESKVVILLNNKEIVNVKSDTDGKFITKDIDLDEGENNFTAKVVENKHESNISKIAVVNFKKTPPKIDISSPKEGEKFYSENKNIVISGKTDPGVKIIINDRLVIVDSEGNFSQSVKLSDGDNNFKIKAIDDAGNSSDTNRKVSYTP